MAANLVLYQQFSVDTNSMHEKTLYGDEWFTAHDALEVPRGSLQHSTMGIGFGSP